LLFARAESRGLPINFVQVRQPRPPRDPHRQRNLLAAVGIAAVVLCGALGCWYLLSKATQGRRDVQGRLEQATAKVTDSSKDAKLLKALDDWDNVVWPDELYDLTARIPDANALRITSLAAEQITRTAKSIYTAKITIKGSFVGNEGRNALDQLIDAFKHDGYYSPEPPNVTGQDFKLVVNVERRPPTEYHHTLKHTPEPIDNGGFGFGDAQP
jgi:hypothetical protein